MTYGGAVSLTGFVRGAERRVARGEDGRRSDWAPAGALAARRRRLVLDDREAAGRRPSTGSPGATCAPGSRRSRSRRASTRTVDCRPACRGRSARRSPARAGRAPAAGRHAWTTRLVDGHRRGRRRGRSPARSPPGTYRVRCAPGQRARRPASRRRSPVAVRRRAAARGSLLAALAVPAVAARVRQHRAARGEAVVPRPATSAWAFWPTQPQLYPGEGRGDRLGHRRHASRSSTGRVVAAQVVRRRLAVPRRPRATARSSPARSPPTRSNGIGIAGLAFNARLMIAKVVDARRRRSRSRPRWRRSAGRSTTARG